MKRLFRHVLLTITYAFLGYECLGVRIGCQFSLKTSLSWMTKSEEKRVAISVLQWNAAPLTSPLLRVHGLLQTSKASETRLPPHTHRLNPENACSMSCWQQRQHSRIADGHAQASLQRSTCLALLCATHGAVLPSVAACLLASSARALAVVVSWQRGLAGLTLHRPSSLSMQGRSTGRPGVAATAAVLPWETGGTEWAGHPAGCSCMPPSSQTEPQSL